MMKRIMVIALAGGLVIAACNKNGTTTVCTAANPSTEDAAIKAYNTSHGYGAVKDTTLGIYYQILSPGTGARPTTSSTVTVAYTGRLLNDVGFDSSSTGIALGLSNTIVGWQRGVPLLRAGGTMRLIIPSAYGYGCRAQGTTIPANSPLYFDIKLLQVN